MEAYRDQYATLFNGGRGIVLLAISADPLAELASWARDAELPFVMASDGGTVVGKAYGALARRAGLTNRNLFVVGPDGRIAYRAVPFREVDPAAYQELGSVLDSLAPPSTKVGD
ncbi:MAG: redoxin domain-containing protein [Gemmatimonadales bacterium]